MKKEVKRTRINCEKLHEKSHEKNNAILCVQLELGVVKADSKFMFQLFLPLIKVFQITFDLLTFHLGVDDNQFVMAHGSTCNDFSTWLLLAPQWVKGVVAHLSQQ
jgi:hypothetical protein